MKIEITTVSLSKKGTIWIQAKLLEGQSPATKTVFICEELDKQEEPKEIKNDKE